MVWAMNHPYFFLDFDGVVCDSVPECFLSSYQAYHVLLRGENIRSVALSDKEIFYAYRPFIRTGEDYLLIHDLIRRGVVVTAQRFFDDEIKRIGKKSLDDFKSLFYAAREEILKNDRNFWLELNTLYDGMKDLLAQAVSHPRFYILSTKKPDYIAEILSHHGISWDIRRILFPDSRTKKEVIESVLPAGETVEAVFVDDQLDHLLVAAENRAVKPFLASWGYVKEEWLLQKEVPAIDRPGLRRLAENFIRGDLPRARQL